jgi:GT2 family glycosyltransferase
MAESKPFVTVMVLNYNGQSFLKNCFSSLELTNYPKSKYEVLLVDNGSTDGSKEFVETNFPWVRIVGLDRNYGFGGGNNRGVKFARGQYIAFLNNDTEVTQNWLLELVQTSVGCSIPICASKTLMMKKRNLVDFGGGKLTIVGRGYSVGFLEADNSRRMNCSFTGYPCASSMLINKDVFMQLDGFDEDYFASLDDTDLGWRAWLLGYKTLYCPDSVVYHNYGGTSGEGRLSPLKAFHGTKAPFITIFKNLELKNLFVGIIFALAFDLGEGILLVKSRNIECLKMKAKAYSWLFRHLSFILSKRQVIQEKRKVSDKWLSEMGFLSPLHCAFKEYIRLSKVAPQV